MLGEIFPSTTSVQSKDAEHTSEGTIPEPEPVDTMSASAQYTNTEDSAPRAQGATAILFERVLTDNDSHIQADVTNSHLSEPFLNAPVDTASASDDAEQVNVVPSAAQDKDTCYCHYLWTVCGW